MTENNEYCIDIMRQNLAVIGLLLNPPTQTLIERHSNSRLKGAIRPKNRRRKQEMIEEILRVSKLLNN